jgi:hypothetical protein
MVDQGVAREEGQRAGEKTGRGTVPVLDARCRLGEELERHGTDQHAGAESHHEADQPVAQP